MSDNPDTIDIIVDDMLNDGHTGPADSLEWIQAKMKFYAERIKEAWKRQMSQSWHHREMEELVARHEKEVAELKAAWKKERIAVATRAATQAINLTDEKYANTPIGNAAALRDALSDACYAMFNFLKTQNGGYEEMARALDKGKATLAGVSQQPSGKDEINVAVMRRALEELAHYDDNDANMDDPYCRDGHDCAKIARAALATINENKSDCPAPTGNAAAMREALNRVGNICLYVKENCAERDTARYMVEVIDNIEAALSAPPRNCDAFSKAEVLEVLEDRSFSKEDTIEWLYSTAAERQEENNGRE